VLADPQVFFRYARIMGAENRLNCKRAGSTIGLGGGRAGAPAPRMNTK
jgi:hypothetical protein